MASEAPNRDIGQVLAEFAQIVAREHTTSDILYALGDYARELLPVHGVGVLVAENGGLAVATANTDEGWAIEQLEADLGEGPCTDALRAGEQVIVADLEAAVDRYPRFAPAAMDAGIRSVLALPLTCRTSVIGAVDVLAEKPTELSPGEVATAQVLADVTMAYLANGRIREDTSRLASQLQHALDRRVVVEQAKGKLSERHGEAVDDAYERLRNHARSNQLTVREVAERVLRDQLSL